MADYPSAIKNFLQLEDGVDKVIAAHPNERGNEITAIETELGTNPKGSAADVKTRLAVSLNDDGTLKNEVVTTTKLKTSTGEVSATTPPILLILPGGSYGFWPQLKQSGTTNDNLVQLSWLNWGVVAQTYTTYIGLYAEGGGTFYAQQRYVTASGKDHWLFLLVDKQTKNILSAYSAPDHPAYGNGGNFDKLPHPFISYDETKHEIVLVDNDTISELKAKVTPEKSPLTIINEEYKPNMDKEEIYQPLHSGKFLTENQIQIKQVIASIPDYIKVRKLVKLTDEEKLIKENLRQIEVQEAQGKKAQEDMIRAKIRELAIEKLKTEGKVIKDA